MNPTQTQSELPPQRTMMALMDQCESKTQAAAFFAYKSGFNVFPQPYARKGGYPWKQFQYTRLDIYSLPAAFAGRCNIAVMMGRTSDNLFVIDAETREQFEYYVQELTRRHIPICAAVSGGKKGGGHLYLRCIEGEIANIPPGKLKDTEIRGNHCYVLMPPSIHPDTHKPYTWLTLNQTPPRVSIKDLAWLGVTLERKQTKPPALEIPYASLSRRNRDFLLNGAPSGERNDRLFAAACDMKGNGYDEAHALQVLMSAARFCGLPERSSRDTIQSAYSKPRLPAKPFARATNHPHEWEQAIAWAQSVTWSGRGGAGNYAAFMALCGLARHAAPDGRFRASHREIAERARMNRNTVGAVLKRLAALGLIALEGHDKTSGATLVRLTWQKAAKSDLQNQDTPYHPVGGGVSVPVLQNVLASDAAERKALGVRGSQLYAVLLSQKAPQTRKALAQAARLTYHQACAALKRLARFGLVVEKRTSDGKPCFEVAPDAARTPDALDQQVAAAAGTLGKAQQRRDKHRRERMRHITAKVIQARGGQRFLMEVLPPDVLKAMIENCEIIPPVAFRYGLVRKGSRGGVEVITQKSPLWVGEGT